MTKGMTDKGGLTRYVIETATDCPDNYGINYWARADKYKDEPPTLYISEMEDDGETVIAKHIVTVDTIRNALEVLEHNPEVVYDEKRKYLVGEMRCYTDDTVMMDTEDCDIIIQVGLFGELRYG